jgi:hypothetical protein
MASVCVEVLAYLWMEAEFFALSGHVAPSIGVSGGLMGDTKAFAATEIGWRVGSCWRSVSPESIRTVGVARGGFGT